jgi:hypothetical protein
MSANKLLVADAAALCAKQNKACSEKQSRQVASGRDGSRAAVCFLKPIYFLTSQMLKNI